MQDEKGRKHACLLQKGFTYIELLVYIGVLSTVIISVILMVGEMFKIQAKIRGAFVLKENLDYAMHRFSYAVQNGYDIVVPATSTGTWLRMQMSTGSADTVDFSLIDGQVTMSVRNETPVPITSREVQIDSLVFQRLQGTPPSIRFVLDGELRHVDPSFQTTAQTHGTASVRR